jgi:hypothetical protein
MSQNKILKALALTDGRDQRVMHLMREYDATLPEIMNAAVYLYLRFRDNDGVVLTR